MTQKTLFWFRQDLRLSDNPGLYEAAQKGTILPVYIRDKSGEKMGGASQWWLHQTLSTLNIQLDGKLQFHLGLPEQIIFKLLEKYGLNAVYWNRCYDPSSVQRDTRLKAALKSKGIECQSFNASLLWEPWEILKKDGTPYQIFTPFYRGCLQAQPPRKPLPPPHNAHWMGAPTSLADLQLLPNIPWHHALEPHWEVGEAAAENRFKNFLEHGLNGYQMGRNFPAQNHVSRLSPHLHFGEISPHVLWHAIETEKLKSKVPIKDLEHFESEIVWREFSHALLYHFPELPSENFQKKFNAFPWNFDENLLKAWQTGQTGYPIVDAGMRELWQTGYMHNRVRMIVGSFLVKNLMIDWRHGVQWFWDCLVDADLANNSASWQWVAGSGADAAPYFRIFNPVTQGEKFDPDGIYTRRFIPELQHLPLKYLFKPWEAPASVLKQADILLGQNYPKPVVNLQNSRQKALDAFARLNQRKPGCSLEL